MTLMSIKRSKSQLKEKKMTLILIKRLKKSNLIKKKELIKKVE